MLSSLFSLFLHSSEVRQRASSHGATNHLKLNISITNELVEEQQRNRRRPVLLVIQGEGELIQIPWGPKKWKTVLIYNNIALWWKRQSGGVLPKSFLYFTLKWKLRKSFAVRPVKPLNAIFFICEIRTTVDLQSCDHLRVRLGLGYWTNISTIGDGLVC